MPQGASERAALSCRRRPTPPARRAVELALPLLIALGPAALCAERGDEHFLRERADLDAEFAEQLEAVADKCDELGLEEQARITRQWVVRRDPRRQYIFLPPDSDPTRPPTGAAQLVGFWHRRFTELRKRQADALFELSRRAVGEDQPTLAFQWLHEVLCEDPDHAEARRVLGYQRVGDKWRAPFAQSRATAPSLRHPQFGWRPRRYWRVETAHFRIATSHSKNEGLELGRRLEELYAVWRQLFFRYWTSREALATRLDGGPPLDQRRQHRVVLFRDRGEYLAQLGRASPRIGLTSGYYLDKNRTAYFYVGDDQDPALWFHEATHQLFHESASVAADVGETCNYWLVEGAALHMESLARSDRYYTVGGSDANRLQYARYRALNERFYTPLEELAGYGREALQQDENIRRLYSQSAGLTSFLMDYDRGRYRRALVDCLRLVYQGAASEETLARLTKTSYSDLDAQYHEFLNVTDADLAHLRAPPQVRNLSLGHTDVTDRGLARLAGRAELEWLDLTAAKITDAGAAHLKSATGLKQLSLEQTQITDKALEAVAALTQLEVLDLSGTRITDAGLHQLAGLKNLKELWLESTLVSDAGLTHLQDLVQLEVLDLSGARVTDAGLKQLAGLRNLRELWLTSTLVSNAGLAHLQNLTRLEMLEASGTGVTPEGLRQLERHLPRLRGGG
jgi:hypothetical protein